MTTIRQQVAEELRTYAIGPNSSVLASNVIVQLFDDGRWVNEATGSSVAWLAAAADDAADFGRVRIVTQYGAIIAGEGAEVIAPSFHVGGGSAPTRRSVRTVTR